MLRSAKLIERMLAQNDFDEITQDFKYYEDDSDMYKDEGSILPLWRFSNDFIKKKCINSVSWNRKYDDLFAISAGSSNKLIEIHNDFFCIF